MKKHLREEIRDMIAKEVMQVKIPQTGNWYTSVNLHDLIIEVLNHCGLSVSYTEPAPRKITIWKSEKSKEVK